MGEVGLIPGLGSFNTAKKENTTYLKKKKERKKWLLFVLGHHINEIIWVSSLESGFIPLAL